MQKIAVCVIAALLDLLELPQMKRLPREFYLREDTIAVAKDLLGKLLVVPDQEGKRVSGMIVELEAYLGVEDKAAHSFGGRRTARNEVTFGIGGHAYVFFIYGMYYQLNFVTGPSDHPHVVLIRAVEPIEGIEVMRERRGSMKDKNLTSGPGKLCIAFGIGRSLNGAHMTGNTIWVEEHRSFVEDQVASGKRIGIDYAGDDAEKPWRFWVRGNEFVSRTPKS
ncbi:MAG: DNA-3-methyladenine glycosylase [Pyrinomonadaceae bacterium]|nr:DNA-3-methyladenine glycosylase [Pyrinomonadaceae bacterium]